MKSGLLCVCLVACSACGGESVRDPQSAGAGAGGTATGGTATGGTATGGTGGGVTGGAAGQESTGGAASCPSQWECNGEYPGSFECFCDVGEYTHPAGCDTTLDDVLATVGTDTTSLFGYAECGLALYSVPIGFDGPQWYVFDLETRRMVGSRQTSDHAPTCSAGRLPGADCAVTSCTGEPTGYADQSCPEECPPPPPGAAAGTYPTTFRFVAPAGETLFLRDVCGFGAELSACTDRYAHSLDRPFCEGECAGADTACMVCGACEMLAVPITSDTSADFVWVGELYEQRVQGELPCSCYVRHPLSPGRYRVSVPVYASEQDALEDRPAFTAAREFDLTSPDGVVEVILQP